MLHIIQNDPEVPPGLVTEYLTVPYLVHHAYLDGILPQPQQISALIVMGGAMSANDDDRYPFLINIKQLIREVVDAGIPYLGICLGGQLLASALGSKVVSNRWEELGILQVALTVEGKKDRLFNGIAEKFITFQWHHDSFDLPEGSVLLAGSELCPHQAFRIGTAAWGLQFHPEVTDKIIRDWCSWNETTRIKTDEIVEEFTNIQETYRLSARLLLENFITLTSATFRFNSLK